MKKLAAIFLIISFLFSFTACAQNKPEKNLPKGATEDEKNYPKKLKYTSVENDNATGKIYNFTLSKYTTAFNTMYEKLGGDHKDFPYKNWKKQNSETQSNGKTYNFYYLKGKAIVLTATEEEESKNIVNVGCGTTVKNFNSSDTGKVRFMTICGIMASAAGGYSSNDVNFFTNLFTDTISADEHSFWYDGSIYLYEKEDTDDKNSTVLFRTLPASVSIEEEWNLQDYKKFWFDNK